MKFKSKPIVIDAVRFNSKNDRECLNFCKDAIDPISKKPYLIIPTALGDMECNIGDYIVKISTGNFYPLRSDMFHLLFEETE